MSTDIAESLPKRKFAPAPMIAKGAKGKGPAPKGGGKKEAPKGKSGGKEKGASEEGSEKRIRQAVYDIRYRARREDIDLKAAFSQYMSNSSLSQADRTAVREKIFGKTGGMSEKYINTADELAVDGVATALYKVFVEKNEDEKELEQYIHSPAFQNMIRGLVEERVQAIVEKAIPSLAKEAIEKEIQRLLDEPY